MCSNSDETQGCSTRHLVSRSRDTPKRRAHFISFEEHQVGNTKANFQKHQRDTIKRSASGKHTITLNTAVIRNGSPSEIASVFNLK